MSDYDRWLERPYTEAASGAAEYERWLEDEGIEEDTPETWARFEKYLDELERDDDYPDFQRDVDGD